ncbi:MAG: hypothetical protein WAM62_09695 [Pseudolabrys sp.]
MARYQKRIPLVPRGGEPIAFNRNQRETIEAAYGNSLSGEIWKKLIIATGLYLEAAPSERTAVPVKKFLSRLDQLKELAQSIKNDFDEDVGAKKKDKGRILKGDRRLTAIKKKYYQRQDWTEFREYAPFEILAHTLNAVDAVCDFVSNELSDPRYGGHSEGWLWSYWICCLTMIVKEHQLPYEVRKDSDKQKPTSPISPFVLFVDELQKCIPVEFRRHAPVLGTERREALATAIWRSRRGVNVDCKFSEVIDIPGINEILR